MENKKNRLAGLICYEIGPIDRVDDRGGPWRDDISEFLFSLDIGVHNPLKKSLDWGVESEDGRLWRQDSLQKAELLHSQGLIHESNKICEAVHEQMKDIVASDLRSVDRSDFMIAYVDLDVHMAGSYSEITHATLQRKPVIICCEQGKYHIPMWLYGLCQHEMFFSNWDEVKIYINHMAYDDNVDHLKRWRFFNMNKIYNREIF
jgi:hypothetical protein